MEPLVPQVQKVNSVTHTFLSSPLFLAGHVETGQVLDDGPRLSLGTQNQHEVREVPVNVNVTENVTTNI